MNFALGQINVIPGKPRKNVDQMLKMIDQAKEKNVDIIAFPEMVIGGYLLGDKWLEDSYCEELMSYNDELLEASKGIAIIYGNVYVDRFHSGYHPNKDGRSRKYNAIYAMQNGEYLSRFEENQILPQGIQPKTLLPNYRFFDDQRYFFSLLDVARDFGVELKELVSPFLIKVGGKKINVGIELCEDLWCEDYRENEASINITKFLIEKESKYIFNLSASPWTYGKNSARDRRVKYLKQESENFVPYFYVNCVGVQNNGKNIITFDGGSTVYNSGADPIIFGSESYMEELIIISEKELGGETLQREYKNKIDEKYFAIINGLKSIRNWTNMEKDFKFVIGLSGGIDSALVACLLVKAIGKENVVGINMPTKYNSDKTKNSAKFLAEKLRIEYKIIPIEELVKVNEKLLESDGKELSEFNLENVQAKIRGTSIQSNLSAKYNGMFSNNGNKIEIALGYATLYGDWGGAISPLGDLTKTEVVEMSKFMNKEIFGEEVIPENLFPDELWNFSKEKIEPSAELKNAQVDPMKFGYHCKLIELITDYKKKSMEEIMQWYLDEELIKKFGISEELFLRWGLDNSQEFMRDLEWFYDKINNNVFKRVQSPPIIVTSKSAYGYDIRESILPISRTKKFFELKDKILKKGVYKK